MSSSQSTFRRSTSRLRTPSISLTFLLKEIPPGKKRRLSIALLIALFIAAVVLHLKPETSHSHLTGDFPAFYSAAKIVWSGQGKNLYDLELQQSFQVEGEFLPFAYPPYFAALLSPLSALEFRQAKLLWTLLMLVFAAGGSYLLANSNKQPFIWIFAFSLAFAPLFSSVIGGQNASLSLFLFLLAAGFLDRGADFKSGFFLGLAFFKPHFAALFLFCLFFRAGDKLKFLSGLSIPLLLFFVLATMVLSLDWLPIWFQFAQNFSEMEALNSLNQQISVNSLLLRFSDANLAIIISIILFLVSVYFWAKTKTIDSSRGATLMVSLFSPHTLYYDAALILPSLVAHYSKTYLALVLLLVSLFAVVFKAAGATIVLLFFATYLLYREIFMKSSQKL